MVCYCMTQVVDSDTSEMCKLFDDLKSKAKWSSTIVGVFIAVVNFIFRSMMIYFANLLKPET